MVTALTRADWQKWAQRSGNAATSTWLGALDRTLGDPGTNHRLDVTRYCFGVSNQLTANPPQIYAVPAYWLWLLLEVEPEAAMELLALPFGDLINIAKLGNPMASALLPAKYIAVNRTTRRKQRHNLPI